jgi:hypothetical protein
MPSAREMLSVRLILFFENIIYYQIVQFMVGLAWVRIGAG